MKEIEETLNNELIYIESVKNYEIYIPHNNISAILSRIKVNRATSTKSSGNVLRIPIKTNL